MSKQDQEVILFVRLPLSLRDQLQKLAEKSDRSLAQLVRAWLRAGVSEGKK